MPSFILTIQPFGDNSNTNVTDRQTDSTDKQLSDSIQTVAQQFSVQREQFPKSYNLIMNTGKEEKFNY